MFVVFALAAVCVAPPVPGPVTAAYAPVGQYAGHWGIDFAATEGYPVRAPTSGLVTFAGSVAGMSTVTIEPVSGFKVSVSYLDSVAVSRGTRVTRGSIVGSSGSPHGRSGVHLSTRIGGEYVDPQPHLGCSDTDVTRALRLVTPPSPYSRRRAHRNSRRDLRPNPCRSSPHCRMCSESIRTRSHLDSPGR